MSVRITRNASLRRLNSFAVEASAANLVELFEERSLNQALDACAASEPPLILGGGSNLLLTRDLPGSVLRLATTGWRLLDQTASDAIVEVAAGSLWHEFVMWTLAQGWSGLENLALIPGSVGASPIQNIGAYGVELQATFAGLTAIHLSDRRQRDFEASDCELGYRTSVFKQPAYREWIILRVRFRLRKHVSQPVALQLGYGEVRGELRQSGITEPTALQLAQAVIRIRSRKLPAPAELANAGSFFKNPIVPQTRLQGLLERHPTMPVFPTTAAAAGAAQAKLSAAWLIEQCGWKGKREGDAGVFEKHALVLVNHGQATGAQLWALALRIQDSVRQRFGVELEPEPRVV